MSTAKRHDKFHLIKTEIIRDLNTAHYAYGRVGKDDDYTAVVWLAVDANTVDDLVVVLDRAVKVRETQLWADYDDKNLADRKTVRLAVMRARRWASRYRTLLA